MATEKTHTWNQDTPQGLMNTELDEIWAILNGSSAGPFLPLDGSDAMTGTLTLASTGTPLAFQVGGGEDPLVRIKDGTSRMSLYWNASGGLSPLYKIAGEAAQQIILTNPNSTSIFRIGHAPDDGHSANDPVTWGNVFKLFRAGGIVHSLDKAATANGNMFYDATAGRLQGSWNAYLDSTNPTDFRVSAKLLDDTGTFDECVVCDPHQFKAIHGHRSSGTLTVSGGSEVELDWTGTYTLDDIYTLGAGAKANSRITVDKAGWYKMDVIVNLEMTAGLNRWQGLINVRKNGSILLQGYTDYIRGASTVNYGSAKLSFTIFLAAADYIDFRIQATSTAGPTVVIPASPVSRFQLMYMGAYRA